MPDPIQGIFRQPFKEQVAAFRLRLANLVPTARWDDISHEAHNRAFMVAGATKADLLADLAAAVDRALSEGTGFDAFKRDFRGIVEKHGWHGWTGEGSDKGEAWRMRTIYRTNLRTSYMAGRHAQLKRGNYKFWIYRHGGSVEPRLHHLAWDGLILPADHPFWTKHYPPNGWGCSCRVFGANSIAGAIRRGGKPGVKLQPDWDKLDPRTGAPPGIGKGWDYAPGASVADTINTMTSKSVHWPYELAKAYMQGLPQLHADDFARAYRTLPSLKDDLRKHAERTLGVRNGKPITVGRVEPYRTLGRLTSENEAMLRKWGIDAEGFDFTVSDFAIKHIFSKHGKAATETPRGQRAVDVGDYEDLGYLLNVPDRVRHDGGRIVFEKQFGTERLIAVFEPRKKRRMLSLVTMWIVRQAS
jgi:Phage Mu protein F like protein/phage-Barnase-EndoU-ColicinE5/D-RelE like nuclease3